MAGLDPATQDHAHSRFIALGEANKYADIVAISSNTGGATLGGRVKLRHDELILVWVRNRTNWEVKSRDPLVTCPTNVRAADI